MKKTFIIPTIIALVALASFSIALINSTLVHAKSTKTIHIIEHIVYVAVGDVPPPGDSAGDQLVFHNPLFDATDKQQVGQDNGDCVRIVTGPNGVYECFLTIFLSAGQMTLEGPFYSNGADSMLAITGGTGAYQEVQGQARLHATGHPVGSEYDFFLTLVD